MTVASPEVTPAGLGTHAISAAYDYLRDRVSGGSSRDIIEHREGPDGAQISSSVLTVFEQDGTKTVRTVTVVVETTTDNNDDYWDAQARDRSNALVINGQHYRIGANNGRSTTRRPAFRGFGGREFEIEYLDGGRRITVNDLWYQGPIPPAHRDRFPDNARFVNPGQEPFPRG